MHNLIQIFLHFSRHWKLSRNFTCNLARNCYFTKQSLYDYAHITSTCAA